MLRQPTIIGKVSLLPLTKNKFTLVDTEDLPLLCKNTWFAISKPAYAACCYRVNKKNKTFYLHRVLLNAPDNLEVDHINGDTLDNRKVNLRVVPRQQNAYNTKDRANSSGVRGVTWCKKNKKWKSQIKVLDKNHNLGYFNTIEEARVAYESVRKTLHGEFRRV
jgi:hypothetical protein